MYVHVHVLYHTYIGHVPMSIHGPMYKCIRILCVHHIRMYLALMYCMYCSIDSIPLQLYRTEGAWHWVRVHLGGHQLEVDIQDSLHARSTGGSGTSPHCTGAKETATFREHCYYGGMRVHSSAENQL